MCRQCVCFTTLDIYGIVTNSSRYSLEDIRSNCLSEFRAHWQCLEQNNQQMFQCRKVERPLNQCVFQKLVRIYIV